MSGNDTVFDDGEIVGWVPSSTDRGTIDVLWSCCFTIVLCVWVSTYPNVPSKSDTWYERLIDKVNLAFIGLLGPDLLLGLALGQLGEARKIVRMFKDDAEVLGRREWTLTHAFFVNMGGFLLAIRDGDDEIEFPIDGEQLYYLIKHNFVEFPVIDKSEIDDHSRVDGLSKAIAIWQVLWFTVTEIQRVVNGYPMTTLELTALSFSIMMVATSACWYFKPTIYRARTIRTIHGKTVEEIRCYARNNTHQNLPHTWYRTPLDFLSRRHFAIDKCWAYYSQLTHMCRCYILSRPMRRAQLWDRIPSDVWLPVYVWTIPFGLLMQVPFSLAFLAAWRFHFPTEAEAWIWRGAAVYHAVFSIAVGFYFLWDSVCHTDTNSTGLFRGWGKGWKVRREFGTVEKKSQQKRRWRAGARCAVVAADVEKGENANEPVPPAKTTVEEDGPSASSQDWQPNGPNAPPKAAVIETEETFVMALEQTENMSPLCVTGQSSAVAASSRPPVGIPKPSATVPKLSPARTLTEATSSLVRSLTGPGTFLGSWRNISPDGDPDMAVQLRWIGPVFVASFLYTLCRLYFYIEDFAAMRSQPAGVYLTVNRFLPFM